MPYPPFLKADQPNLTPGGIYNAMIHPLLAFGFRGAAWYQGESNADRGEQYRTLLPAMITDWRHGAGRDFPFLVVQLPTYGNGTGWAEVREAEAFTAQRLPKVGLAVTMDIWDGDLHPKIKLPVGRRLALSALAVAYGQKIVASGPVYKSMTIDGNKVRLKFESVGGGLAINRDQAGMPKERFSAELADFRWPARMGVSTGPRARSRATPSSCGPSTCPLRWPPATASTTAPATATSPTPKACPAAPSAPTTGRCKPPEDGETGSNDECLMSNVECLIQRQHLENLLATRRRAVLEIRH